MKLLKITYKQAEVIAKDYKLNKKGKASPKTDHIIHINKKAFKYPSAVSKMGLAHRRYLEKRNFDPDYIEDYWGVKGTSPTSQLDGIPYRYRILAPIYWGGTVVSFQCRDHTDRQAQPYMACPQEREVMHHKHILYGASTLWKKRVGAVLEGIVDAWRLRGHACATFGIQYTPEQVRLLAELFDKVFIIFDPELQAQQQAKKLQEELRFRRVEAIHYTGLETDPGAMSDDDAKHLLKELKLN